MRAVCAVAGQIIDCRTHSFSPFPVFGACETSRTRTERRREGRSLSSDGSGTRRRERFRSLKEKNLDAFYRDVSGADGRCLMQTRR